MSETSSQAFSTRSPLGIIAILLGLVEVTIGAATAFTDGPVQVFLAIFFVLFTIGITTVFFWLVFKKPAAFYPPGEFKGGGESTDYVEGMARVTRRNIETSQSVAASSLAEVMEDEDLDDEVRDRLMNSAKLKLDNSIVSVSLPGSVFPLDVPVAPTTTVNDLLDTVWYGLDGVSASTYGTKWVLTVDPSGDELFELGTTYANNNLNMMRDTRPLAAVGIGAGQHLTVKLL